MIAGAGVEGVARLGGHLRRRDRHRVLLRVGQHAGQRAGEDGFVHVALRHSAVAAASSSSTSSAPAATCSAGLHVPRARRVPAAAGGDPHLHLHRLDAHQRLAGGDRVARPAPQPARRRRPPARARGARRHAGPTRGTAARARRTRTRAPRAPGAARRRCAQRDGATHDAVAFVAQLAFAAGQQPHGVRCAVERDLHTAVALHAHAWRAAAGRRSAAAGRRRPRCRRRCAAPLAQRARRRRRGTRPRRSAVGRCSSGRASRCQSSSSVRRHLAAGGTRRGRAGRAGSARCCAGPAAARPRARARRRRIASARSRPWAISLATIAS